jgi:pyruvate-formate lyase-activating enzyme
MNVLLLHLPLARRSYLSRFSLVEPMGQMYLGAALRKRHDVRLVDLRVTPDLEAELGEFVPDAAVVGVNPVTFASCDRTLAEIRRLFPRLRILLVADAEYGNAHVSERPHDFAHTQADALALPIFLAPMIRVVLETLEAWEGGRSIAHVPGLLRQTSPGTWAATESAPDAVGNIGILDRTLLGRARGRYLFGGIGRMAHLFYTYGCRHKCRFCPMSKHDGSIVARQLDDVMAELSAMTEPNVYLQDYEPFLAPEAMERLADAVERAGIRKNWYMLTRSDTAVQQEALIRRWKGLGLRWLYLGLDGFSPERLKEIRKGNTVQSNAEGLERMRALGLAVAVGFVVRPDFGREEFAALLEHVRKLRPPFVTFTVETPLVGTKLYDESGALLTTRDWSLFDLEHAVLPTRLPLDEFYREMARLQLRAGLRTAPAMLRHFPLRDALRIWTSGPGALADLRRSARDHERPAGGRSSGAALTPAHA